ncbi:MAG: flagellar biosynthetic protein FliR [Desulfobulbaceae bacterium]|nr:flagellar biosynthetic protein FliR [Desulfobulbaceae bacterium]
MELQQIPLEQILLFLTILARVAGCIAAIPIFSTSQAPITARVGLIFFTALLLFPVLAPQIQATSFAPLPFTLFIIAETLLGLLLGLTSRLIFTAVEFGGTVIGYQMGFAAANVYDPTGQRQVALLSQFQNVFAILIFLAVDGHHYFFRLAVHSYELLPPGQLRLGGDAVPYLMQLASHMFTLGVQFSAPVLALLLLSGLILGILARVFPQLNVFMLSFPINIGLSFIVIALTLDMVTALLRREFAELPGRLGQLLQLLAQ